MNILAIGAHPDDIEYGVGGTIAKFIKLGYKVTFLILTNGELIEKAENRREEALKAATILGVNDIIFGDLRDSKVECNRETIDIIEEAIHKVNPNRIYTTYIEEAHQDHRNLALATIAAGRDISSIYFYETPSTFSSFIPHIFVNISDTIQDKINALKAHITQNKKSYMDVDAIESLAKFRGFQTRQKLNYAEAFHIYKHVEF
ncbi:PIG-L family deacetylase [Candidatus Woesearchaeota archaeon]|nr:PIG-L family deacetylase [Candidatus Woesearchaeota archaeon]